jgi:hypothetical protein
MLQCARLSRNGWLSIPDVILEVYGVTMDPGRSLPHGADRVIDRG